MHSQDKKKLPPFMRQREPLQGVSELPDQIVQCCIARLPLWTGKGERNTGYYGTENSPEEYIDKIIRLFKEVNRVLQDDGSLWLIVGDSYWGREVVERSEKHPLIREHLNYKNNDLIGFPWMVAFALRSQGWILRQDLIWHKTNPLPESINDRCVRAHEYIFHFSKTDRYFYDVEVVKESVPFESHAVNVDIHKGKVVWQKNLRKERDPKFIHRHSVWDERIISREEKKYQSIPSNITISCIAASTKIHQIVLDPFMRTGDTAFISRELYRGYIGFEMDAEQVKIAHELISEDDQTSAS